MTSNGQYIFPRFPPPEGCNEVLTISIEALTSLHGNMMNHILTVLSGISDDDTLSRELLGQAAQRPPHQHYTMSEPSSSWNTLESI